ncbi:hypothetical protein TRSC58_06409 [Trypanosoma rangeli SC58]|uniref:HECT-type E3 ubiquitin transferase n=1 Tax=Trypanosoma rangeli SC58 TaxID=429131 RepID=A0A061IVK7_TRYRA|nr:hypothetical protein TRSC58_06409 [Trypanosoma rangeli SC58]
MSAVDGSAGSVQRGKALVLVGDLKSALTALKRGMSEDKLERLLIALDRVCVALCFGDEDFVRSLDAGRYAEVLVSTLTTASQNDFTRPRSLVVQALALLADIAPRGGFAIAAAKGVPQLLRLLNEVNIHDNESLLEEVLKCISHVSLEAHTEVVHAHAVSVITSLEAKVGSHHLRMMCLKCLCHLLAAARLKDWNKYLMAPCNALVLRFSKQVKEILGDGKDQSAERLSKENGAYILNLIECVTFIYDRILCSREQLLKNVGILEHSVPTLVTVLAQTVSMGAQGSTFRNAVCSTFLTFFFTDSCIAVKMFLKYHVFHSVYKIVTALAEKMRLFARSGVRIAEALFHNDVSAIPFMAEEQQIIHLLEFLLVITPAAMAARESDCYVTLPHFVWQCEDDFHNRNDCSDSLSRQLEGEYETQRRCKAFTLYEVSHGSRVLKIDFSVMQYMRNELSFYPHGLSRHAFLSGYVHRRVMYCTCGDNVFTDAVNAAIIPHHQSDYPVEMLRWGPQRSHNPLMPTSTRGNDAVNQETLPTTTLNGAEDSSTLSIPYTSRLNETTTQRLADEKTRFFCCVFLPGFGGKLGRTTGKTRRKNKKNFKTDVLSREAFINAREGLLRDPATRAQFLQAAMIEMIVSCCLPILAYVVKETVSPVIARHCSILILRYVDLTVEFFREDNKGSRPNNRNVLCTQFDLLCSRLGTVLSYLATTNTTQSLTASVQPFREYCSNQTVLHALVSLGFTQHSRLPAMTLRCEIQMSALSSFLILQHAHRPGISIFNDNERLILRRMLENGRGHVSRRCGGLPSSLHGGRGVALCPFHRSTKGLEEAHEKLIEQVISILSMDLPNTHRGPGDVLPSNFPVQSSDGVILRTDSALPSELNAILRTTEESRFSESCIISDIMMRASRHVKLNAGLQKVLAIYEYMLESEDKLAYLVHEHPEFLEQLAGELQDSMSQTVLNARLAEVFLQVREGLLRVINQHLGLVNVEEASPIERQPARLELRFRRNKIMHAMANYIWSPLRVKLELLEVNVGARQPSLTTRSLFIAGEKYTLLDIYMEQEVVSVLPTTPLSYLAKQILFQLRQKYSETGTRGQEVRWRRRHSAPENNELRGLYSLDNSRIPKEGEGDGARSLSFRSLTHMNTYTGDRLGNTGPPVTSAAQLSQENICVSEQSFGATSAALANTYQGQTPVENLSFGNPPLSDTAEDTTYTISLNNIVFFRNGNPVMDSSVSVLELFCNSATRSVDATATATEEIPQWGGEQFATSGVQRVMTLWSMAHTIQYVIVKEPFARDLADATKDGAQGNVMSSPKRQFTQLLRCAETQSSLKSAAKLLNEVLQVLLQAKVPMNYAEGRLCSALIYGFYNYLGVFMLPPVVWFPFLCSSLNEHKDQHLASYILWNFPQVFSLSIRRALLQLVFFVRRVPTTMTSWLKEALRGPGWLIPIHGLEWVTPDVNMHGAKKVVVQRDNLLESGSIVLRTHAMCPLPLSVEFENENGFGAGPAREFYNLFAIQLQKLQLNMWRSEEFMESNGNFGRRVQLPLFPAVCQTSKSLSYFELLGLLVGRVLLEERAVDLPLHRCFIQGILGNLEDNQLRDIDPELDVHLRWLSSLSEEGLLACDLTFVLPNSDADTAGETIELCSNGSTRRVDGANVSDYIDAVRQYYTRKVLVKPIMHFRQGLRYAVIPSYLELFSVEELQLLISGPDGKIWERPEDLEQNIIAAHGYDNNSPVVIFLLEVVSSWDASLQRAFLRFVTGSSRLPLGGMRPPITVVRRTLGAAEETEENIASSDDLVSEGIVRDSQARMGASLPTVSTCAHYLKMPSYSSKALLQEKLRTAVTEGQECFLLT